MKQAEVIGERYVLDCKIGEGGMASVWLARDNRLDRRVAIKFLFARNDSYRERLTRRFAQEAKIAASVQHRNVVQIFDFGTHEGGVPFMVMEALEGYTLGEAFNRGEAFSLNDTIDFIAQALQGLVAVHDAGIVHRDLKPENIFLVKERSTFYPKLLDFGISRSLEPETGLRSAVTTVEGSIVGTPQYMSPEQARGLRDIDKRTDIYAMGVILFEALTGRVPFDSENLGDLLFKVALGGAPSLASIVPQVGKPLCEVVDKALANRRDDRYSDAAEMHSALVHAAEHVPSTLDRQMSCFPPPEIRSRPSSKRSGHPREFSEWEPPRNDLAPLPAPTPASAAARIPAPSAALPASAALQVETVSPANAQHADATSAAKPERSSAPPLWLAALLVGVTLLSVGALVAVLSLSARSAPSSHETGFIVVQGTGQTTQALPSAPVATSTGTASVAEPSKLAKSEPALKRAAAPQTKGKAMQGKTEDPAQRKAAREVTEAFARQKAKVIACLDQHPGEMQGAPQLNIDLTLDARGKVTDVALLPEALGTAEVGGCVTRAVRGMAFPAQAASGSFRIPLRWRRR